MRWDGALQGDVSEEIRANNQFVAVRYLDLLRACKAYGADAGVRMQILKFRSSA